MRLSHKIEVSYSGLDLESQLFKNEHHKFLFFAGTIDALTFGTALSLKIRTYA
jgi:hypothetical protein